MSVLINLAFVFSLLAAKKYEIVGERKIINKKHFQFHHEIFMFLEFCDCNFLSIFGYYYHIENKAVNGLL